MGFRRFYAWNLGKFDIFTYFARVKELPIPFTH